MLILTKMKTLNSLDLAPYKTWLKSYYLIIKEKKLTGWQIFSTHIVIVNDSLTCQILFSESPALPLLSNYQKFPAVNFPVASVHWGTTGFRSISLLVQPRKDFVGILRSINLFSPLKYTVSSSLSYHFHLFLSTLLISFHCSSLLLLKKKKKLLHSKIIYRTFFCPRSKEK